MAEPARPIVLTGRDVAADRAALALLVAHQRDTPPAGLPAPARDELAAALEDFRARHLQVAADARPWRRVADALLNQLLAQPLVALQPVGDGARHAGPLVQDITSALAAAALPESDEIDLAVRWWALARQAGLPVDPDFGECWRAIEWMSLAQALAGMARGPADPAALARAVRVALRYGPLKPLLPLLQPLTGAAPGAGYTF